VLPDNLVERAVVFRRPKAWSSLVYSKKIFESDAKYTRINKALCTKESMRIIAKNIGFVVLAFLFTMGSPFVLVSKDVKQLKPTAPNDTYEVYKSGLPLRYLERSNISTGMKFDETKFFINVFVWYVLLFAMSFIVARVRNKEENNGSSVYN